MTTCQQNAGLVPIHDLGHPFVRRLNGTLWCLSCFARVYGRPIVRPPLLPSSFPLLEVTR